LREYFNIIFTCVPGGAGTLAGSGPLKGVDVGKKEIILIKRNASLEVDHQAGACATASAIKFSLARSLGPETKNNW
jgi:hypothetical protein